MSDQCADFHSNVPEQQLLLELLSFHQVRCDPVLLNSMNTMQSVKSSLKNSFCNLAVKQSDIHVCLYPRLS